MTPIAIFTYNRPDHLEYTLKSILNNHDIEDAKIFFFSDGPKNYEDELNITKTRKIISKVCRKNKNYISIFRDKNYGLKHNIISGVSEVLSYYDKLIILEDDLLTSKYFYKLLSYLLNIYSINELLGSVTGFMYPIKQNKLYEYDICFTYRHSSWGWGTWRNIWDKVDWNIKNKIINFDNLNNKVSFNRSGPDMTNLLKLEKEGKVNSWSIIFDYNMWKLNKLSAAPVLGHIRNIGLDGTGTHKVKIKKKDTHTYENEFNKNTFRLPEITYPDKYINDEIYRIHKTPLLNKIYEVIFK